MEFNAIINKLSFKFNIEWGDTTRIRDIYYPYLDLEVSIPQPDLSWLPNLKLIRLYSFEMHYPDVWDQFDDEGFWRHERLSRLTSGSTLLISGPVHRRLSKNDSPFFGSYDYLVLRPGMHGEELDINGKWSADITEWLVEKNALFDETEVHHTSKLVVGWECAWQLKDKA